MALIWIALLIFSISCAWTLVDKTGNPGWMCLLFCIPFVNLLLWLYFVFSEWPIEQELKRYKKLYGELEPRIEDDMSAAITCMQCRATIPAGTAVCPSCGWSYKAGNGPAIGQGG